MDFVREQSATGESMNVLFVFPADASIAGGLYYPTNVFETNVMGVIYDPAVMPDAPKLFV